MKDLKITIDQLKNYLGTGLKFTNGNEIVKMTAFNFHDCLITLFFKPLCYRLSDLDKFIPELGFVPIEEIKKSDFWCDAYDEWYECTYPQEGIDQAPFEVTQLLFQWHFWTFGSEYFNQGLVIDKLSVSASLRENGKDGSNA
jgi:hypothetical protein